MNKFHKNYQELCKAIVEQAKDDYRLALETIKNNPQSKRIKRHRSRMRGGLCGRLDKIFNG